MFELGATVLLMSLGVSTIVLAVGAIVYIFKS